MNLKEPWCYDKMPVELRWLSPPLPTRDFAIGIENLLWMTSYYARQQLDWELLDHAHYDGIRKLSNAAFANIPIIARGGHPFYGAKLVQALSVREWQIRDTQNLPSLVHLIASGRKREPTRRLSKILSQPPIS